MRPLLSMELCLVEKPRFEEKQISPAFDRQNNARSFCSHQQSVTVFVLYAKTRPNDGKEARQLLDAYLWTDVDATGNLQLLNCLLDLQSLGADTQFRFLECSFIFFLYIGSTGCNQTQSQHSVPSHGGHVHANLAFTNNRTGSPADTRGSFDIKTECRRLMSRAIVCKHEVGAQCPRGSV